MARVFCLELRGELGVGRVARLVSAFTSPVLYGLLPPSAIGGPPSYVLLSVTRPRRRSHRGTGPAMPLVWPEIGLQCVNNHCQLQATLPVAQPCSTHFELVLDGEGDNPERNQRPLL